MDYQLIIDYYIGNWGYSKHYVRQILDKYKGKHVDVKISSFGGELSHGLDIMQQFRDHGDVTAYIHGMTASAATVIAIGAKKVVMSKYAFFMVHKCSNGIDIWGNYNADQMQQLIEQLTKNKQENDRIDAVLANLYANRCKKKVSEILDVLKEGRWLTADEALSMGFIDEITEDGTKLNYSDDTRHLLNAIGLPTSGLPDPVPEKEDESLFQRIRNSIFPPKDPGANSAPKPAQKITNISKNMDANFKAVDDVIKAGSALAADDKGNVTLTADQTTAICNELTAGKTKIDELTADIAAKEAKIKALEDQVKNLNEAPGAETGKVREEDTPKEDMGAAILNFAKSINI